MGVWLFVVLILSSSYTASLSSMLTVQKLEPNYMELLKKNDLPVGCTNPRVKGYLVNTIGFKEKNVKRNDSYSVPFEFKQENIFALFLEPPHDENFLKNCKDYTSTRQYTPLFGGMGFVSINWFNP